MSSAPEHWSFSREVASYINETVTCNITLHAIPVK